MQPTNWVELFWATHALIKNCEDPKEKTILIDRINMISSMILSRAVHDG